MLWWATACATSALTVSRFAPSATYTARFDGASIRQILQQNRAVNDDVALLAAVVVEDVDHAKRHIRFAERQRDRVTRLHVMLVGERLADDHVVALVHLGVHLLAWAAGDKLGAAKLVDAFRIRRAQRRGHSLIADFVAAKAVHAGDAGKLGDGIGECRVDGRMAVGRWVACGTEKEVGFELVVNPRLNRLAKAADHDSDRDHHGDRGGERSDQHRTATQRR